MENEEMIEKLLDEIEKLRKENADLEKKLEAMRAKSKGAGGMKGFIVRTPAKYNGEFAGVIFRNGEAFIPHSRAELAKELAEDFGYEVEAVEDYVP